MIDKSTKISILNKIAASKVFENSDSYIELLKFLIDAEINNETMKEYTIAVEVFKKGKDFNPANDPCVRTYMHRLRNKIKLYYKDEGKHNKYILEIPKGHYTVQYRQRSLSKRYMMMQKISGINIVLFGIIAVLIITTLFFYSKYRSIQKPFTTIDNAIQSDDPIWMNFFSNKLPTSLVIGDHLQYWELDPETHNSRLIIDYKINDIDAFEQFSMKFPKRILQKERHGGLPINCIWNTYDLMHVLYSFNQKANIEISSLFIATEFDLKNIIDRNIIYVGGFRNLRKFNSILSKLPIEYNYIDPFKGVISIRDTDNDSLLTFVSKKLDNEYNIDIGLIVKVKGSNNENYIILAGFAFPAQIEVVRMLSRNQLLSEFYSQLSVDKLSYPEQFISIIEVKCTEFTVIDANVKYFSEIHQSQ